jgi:hypothetical protein
MKAYEQSASLEELNERVKMVGIAHGALQDLEAGAKPTPRKQATATSAFLEVIGYYPIKVRNSDNGMDLIADYLNLIHMGDEKYGIEFVGSYENGSKGRSPLVPIFGPNNGYDDLWPEPENVMALVETAFPSAVVTNSVMIGNDNVALHHVSVRPAFMQDDDIKYPVMSGSAVSESLSLALMQATIRMIAGMLAEECASLALDDSNMLRRERSAQKSVKVEPKSLSEIYGDYEKELENRISEVLNKKFGIK